MSNRARYWSVLRLTIICLAMCGTLNSCGISRKAQLPHFTLNATHYREYPQLSDEQRDSLLLCYGENKIFIDEFLEPTLIALSHYPELRDTEIEFKYSSEATTMAARPKPASMLWKRRYVVVVNNRESFEGIHLEDVPRNAQIGVIGHELAHIADYENHNFFGVVGILMRYSSRQRKPLFEREVDRATIERGLGWQLYDWAQYSMSEQSGATPEYIEFKRNHYLEAEQIKDHINFFSQYNRSQ